MAARRDVGPFLAIIRQFLIGRKWKGLGAQLRYEDVMSPRPGPQPIMPPGEADKIAANYYFTRDARRDHEPPKRVSSGQKQLLSGDGSSAASSTPRPGKLYEWSEVRD